MLATPAASTEGQRRGLSGLFPEGDGPLGGAVAPADVT